MFNKDEDVGKSGNIQMKKIKYKHRLINQNVLEKKLNKL